MLKRRINEVIKSLSHENEAKEKASQRVKDRRKAMNLHQSKEDKMKQNQYLKNLCGVPLFYENQGNLLGCQHVVR